jgi:hypothetical protein
MAARWVRELLQLLIEAIHTGAYPPACLPLAKSDTG